MQSEHHLHICCKTVKILTNKWADLIFQNRVVVLLIISKQCRRILWRLFSLYTASHGLGCKILTDKAFNQCEDYFNNMCDVCLPHVHVEYSCLDHSAASSCLTHLSLVTSLFLFHVPDCASWLLVHWNANFSIY